jgi:HAMP domain-containing protein
VIEIKLAPTILTIVILASVLPLAILGYMSFTGVSEFGNSAKTGVAEISQEYLTKAGEEAVKMKASDVALQISIYVKKKLEENPNLTTRDLMNDPEFQKIALQSWGAKEYTWVGAGAVIGGEQRAVIIAHPTLPKEALGLDVKYHLKWDKQLPELYTLLVKILENPENPQPVCGYYKWKEPETKEEYNKYLCHYPTSIKIYDPVLKEPAWLVVGTSAYIDGYFMYLTQSKDKPGENILSEIDKSIESASGKVALYFAISVVLAMIFIAGLGYFTISGIANPIIELSNTADRISEGDIELEVPYQNRDDEIGTLAKSIERLRRSIKIATKSLEDALK